MSNQINQELQASGIAQVLVFIKPSEAASLSIKDIHSNMDKNFVKSERSQNSALAASLDRSASDLPTMRYYPNLGIALGTVNKEGLKSLKSEKGLVSDITSAPQMSLIRPFSVASNVQLVNQHTWGIKALGVPELWDAGFTGKDVWVGHLDTGIDGEHPALKDAIADFAFFDELGIPLSPAPKAFDTDTHGTHTGGTIAGRPVGGLHIGVAPEAKLASATVIEGGNVIARILGGMDWTIGKGIKILNMSLGFRGWVTEFLPLTRRIRQRGILPVFASGNEGPGTSRSPGNYWQALSVGAHDETNDVAWFSSSQTFVRVRDSIVPDLVAPGVNTISAKPGGGYQSLQGTSMATPHISGLAALLWQAKPTATVNQIENAIFKSCQLPANVNLYRANRGIPFAPKALDILLH